MRNFRSAFLAAVLLLSALGSAGAARAQAIPFDIEVGYRFLTVTGNEETYRSQINESEGFLVRSLHIGEDGKSEGFPIVDRLRIDGADLGAGPAGSLMLDTGLTGAYRLRASYRHFDVYSALAGFANPLGASVGQQTWNRTRNVIDVNLELLPGAVVTPLVGYTSNDMTGPGYSTTTLGGDEFQVAQDLHVHDQEFRVGAGFNFGPVSGEVLEGWRVYHETETLKFINGKGIGNNPGLVLDQSQTLSAFSSTNNVDVNTPTTSAFVRGFVTDSLQLSGFYVKSIATGDDTSTLGATGSLVSFPLSRFFTGLTENTTSGISNTVWRAGARVEWTVLTDVNLSGGFTRRNATWDGQDIVSSLFTGTTSYTGFTLADIQTLLSAKTSIQRTEDVYDVQVAAKAFGPFGFRVGYSQIQQNVIVTPDPAEIVIPGGQGGNFDRNIDRFEGAVTFAGSGFFVAAEAAWDDANAAIMRTDYLTRNRERVRATWKGFGFVTLGATGLWIDQKNDTVGSDGSLTQYSADLTLTPLKWLRVHGAYGQLKSDTSILVRAPQDFSTFFSTDSQDGELWEAGLGLKFAKLAFDGFWTRFDNVGTYAYRLYRGGARAAYDFNPKIGVIGEWAVDRYLDEVTPSASYRADRIGAYLKWRP